MAEKDRYPQIPSTVWWGVRTLLQRAPNATVDERYLSAQLGVQEAAARQYITELKNVGILTDEGKATPLAQKWRLDDKYAEAVRELIAANYQENLVHVAADRDRSTIVRWFMSAGLGQGAAGNKAATYLLISSPTPNEAPSRANTQGAKEGNTTASKPRRTRERASAPSAARQTASLPATASGVSHTAAVQPDAFPLHVNVQIHISADAGSEQIESIFSAMRRYLYDKPSA